MFKVKRKCLSCDCEYEHDIKDKYADHMKDYVRYLGCCKEDCFYKEPKRKRNRLMFGAFIRGLKDMYK